MEFQLAHNTTLNTTNHHQEFQDAVSYLLDNFPPKNTTSISVSFLKKDGVNFTANGDYEHKAKFPGCFIAAIRVAYGHKKRDPKTLEYLFHEYKHLLQDDDGYLYAEETKHINHCIEAQTWAEEQVPIYLKMLEAGR